MGLNNIDNRNPGLEAKNVLEFGFQLISKIKLVKKELKIDVDMRIGINTGKIIGGVMGTDIVRYDIYGKDVLIANKMESNGEVGKVLIS